MTLADRAVALLLPPALQGAPISATSPIAVLRWRCQLMTLRFMCCRPNPDPFFAGPGSSSLPLAQSDPCGSCLLEYPVAYGVSSLWEWGEGKRKAGKVDSLPRYRLCGSSFDEEEEPKWGTGMKQFGMGGMYFWAMGSFLLNEAFLSPRSNRARECWISRNCQGLLIFLFFLNLKITQEELSIGKSENTDDQKEENNNKCLKSYQHQQN